MSFIFNLAYPYIFIFLVVLILAAVAYRCLIWQPLRYKSALSSYLIKSALVRKRHISEYVFFIIRLLQLILLAVLVARPWQIDPKSKVKVEGVDIVLVLDTSSSMQMFDDINDKESRIEVAKREAINFVNKRDNDPIGLVLFARYAVSRCPLTLDKSILRQIIDKVHIGEIEPNGTMLSVAMMTAINRLKRSQAKSKLMIVLTDGQPTPGDVDPQVVIDIANKLGIKIYTVGIGSKDGSYFDHPLFGVIRTQEFFNQKILEKVAADTGGQFFHAKNADDMRQIYNKIDQLERTLHQTSVFTKKKELFGIVILMILFLIFVEIFLSYFVWFGIR